MTLPTATMLMAATVFGPVQALAAAPTRFHFLFIIMAALQLDFRLSAFSGLVAALFPAPLPTRWRGREVPVGPPGLVVGRIRRGPQAVLETEVLHRIGARELRRPHAIGQLIAVSGSGFPAVRTALSAAFSRRCAILWSDNRRRGPVACLTDRPHPDFSDLTGASRPSGVAVLSRGEK